MPHTSHRKKKTAGKRLEVADDDGWTRVTTTNQARRAPTASSTQGLLDALGPSRTVPEAGMTLEKLRADYEKARPQWAASDACKALEVLVRDHVLRDDVQIDRCVIFGSGSFCGLRKGWISRRNVAMCQLAVLQSVKDILEAAGRTISMHAQDPAYNDLDVEFLKSLGVAVEEDPRGFDLLSEKSLVYTPYGEMHVEMEVIKRAPAMYLTNKLDWLWRNEQGQACTRRQAAQVGADPEGAEAPPSANDSLEQDCQAFERFVQGRREARLPSLDVKDNPFTNQHLYWTKVSEDGDGYTLSGRTNHGFIAERGETWYITE